MFSEMKTLAASAAASLLAFAAPASAATLVQYNFADNSGVTASEAPAFVAANLTGNAFTRGSGLTAVSAAGAFNASGWSNYTTAGGANDFLTFGFTVASGYSATVNQLVFASQRSNTGPASLSVLASIDGGAFASIDTFTTGTSASTNTVDFGPLTGTSSLIFRIVSNVTTTNQGGTFRVQNPGANPVSVFGDVTLVPIGVVPEPATWAMMIAGVGFVGGIARRRKATVSVRFA